ncbi:MAG: tRNA (N(6)-L-threonylcarbamoyladenosine(37)-C(2))-methylthiotransferase MtaB [Bacteroidales bacterium]|jgi:threonylcarbamoyladenosine tRNA methylthiotransferase MtaB|nr:tRNA (N(6)-L-threonylcarbamoyladenosine(37)-C(2))-methylthiotransferase MtaB [Bacteroidales bacterium]
MKVALTTLGCKLNYAETSTYERGFVAHGLEVVPWNKQADVYVINTCAVTETAEKKSRNLMRRAHKLAPDALIIVTGCYAELKKEKLYEIEGVSRVFGAAEKQRVVPETLSLLSIDGSVKTDGFAVETLPAFSSGERTRSFLKVQDGCNNFCAYCTVPYARGRSRNIPICEVVKQAEQIAAMGIKEVVLTGVNTGDFGRTTGESFLDLLKALDKVEGIERYRISSIEPNLITEEIVDWIASGTKFQRHFHIPLQSGSDTLLKKVGRRYDTALFASRIDYIRKAMEHPGEPKVFFGIDVIVGLPGETEELFLETYNFLKDRIKPAYLHVFPYSKRPGTRAAVMPDQVQDSVKTERVARLEALCSELHDAFVAENKGLPELVLWESSVKDGMMAGYTGNYIRVEKTYDPALVNQLEAIVL